VSVQAGVLATLLACVLGTAAALAPARSRFPVKALVVGFLVSPMIVLAIALYGIYAKLKLVGSLTGLVIAHAALGPPM